MMKKAIVTIYSKPGCHLCEEAKAAINEARAERDFTLEEVNIDLDAAAADLYRYDIPVVFINGVKAFKHRVSAREFLKKLGRLS